MANTIRKVKDAKDLETNELIYLKGHAGATYMSDGSTVEDAINGIQTVDVSNKLDKTEAANTYATKTEVLNKVTGDSNITNIAVVSALPSNPNSKTLYIIIE